MSLSIFTSMTNPEERGDPWKEALNCYNQVADEVVVVGDNWPHNFSWDYIGKTFQEGYDKCSSDDMMDIDYFFHQNDILNLEKLSKYGDFPALAFLSTKSSHPIDTKLKPEFNSFYQKFYKNIKLNGVET